MSVYFRLFDPDAPKYNEDLVDDNDGPGEQKYGDNRPGGAIRAALAQAEVQVQPGGSAAETTVPITGMQPGNNWKAAASCDEDYADAVHFCADGVALAEGSCLRGQDDPGRRPLHPHAHLLAPPAHRS